MYLSYLIDPVVDPAEIVVLLVGFVLTISNTWIVII